MISDDNNTRLEPKRKVHRETELKTPCKNATTYAGVSFDRRKKMKRPFRYQFSTLQPQHADTVMLFLPTVFEDIAWLREVANNTGNILEMSSGRFLTIALTPSSSEDTYHSWCPENKFEGEKP